MLFGDEIFIMKSIQSSTPDADAIFIQKPFSNEYGTLTVGRATYAKTTKFILVWSSEMKSIVKQLNERL